MQNNIIAMRDAFLNEIYLSMKHDDKIFFVTADFGSPVLDKIRADFSERFINVGIAEQNLINVCAGLAIEGFKVFAYAIAPFITMRCYEQIRVNLALLSSIKAMNVTLIGVGAGYSYVVSGPTHQCYEDISIMRTLPNIRVLSPSDHVLTKSLFGICCNTSGIKYLRLDAQLLPLIYKEITDELQDGFISHETEAKICIVATGYMVHTARQVAMEFLENKIHINVIDIFDLTNLNILKLKSLLVGYKLLISLEEGFAQCSGLDALIFNLINKYKLNLDFRNIGVEKKYHFEIGTRLELHEQVGIGVNSIKEQIVQYLRSEPHLSEEVEMCCN